MNEEDILTTEDIFTDGTKKRSSVSNDAMREAAINKKAANIGGLLGAVGGIIGAIAGGPQGALTGYNLGSGVGTSAAKTMSKSKQKGQGLDLSQLEGFMNMIKQKKKKTKLDFSKLTKDEIDQLSDEDYSAYQDWLKSGSDTLSNAAVDLPELPTE